ncbi:MAG: carbohydrate-binding domain-containing protein, partial [Defluviitaleaceae bacterium]|nr:carbohydrate-binding domain-containing protein [Defluviitaleaceae bacterium]
MNNFKRFLSVLLTLVLAFGCLAFAPAVYAGESGDSPVVAADGSGSPSGGGDGVTATTDGGAGAGADGGNGVTAPADGGAGDGVSGDACAGAGASGGDGVAVPAGGGDGVTVPAGDVAGSGSSGMELTGDSAGGGDGAGSGSSGTELTGDGAGGGDAADLTGDGAGALPDTTPGAGVTALAGDGVQTLATTISDPLVLYGEYADEAAPDSAGPGWTWASDSRTLSLDGLDFEGAGTEGENAAICLPTNSTIVLTNESSNTIKNETGIGIYAYGDLTIAGQGAGALDISADSCGILAYGSVLINSGAVMINVSGDDSTGITAGNSINVSGGSVGVTSAHTGIDPGAGGLTVIGGTVEIAISYPEGGVGISSGVYGGVNICGGTLTIHADSENAYGIYQAGSVKISKGALTITSRHDGINAGTGNVTISGGAVDIDSGNRGISAGNVAISGGSVTVKAISYGINSDIGGVSISGGAIAVASNGAGITAQNVTMSGCSGTISTSGNNTAAVSSGAPISAGRMTVKGWDGADYTIGSEIVNYYGSYTFVAAVGETGAGIPLSNISFVPATLRTTPLDFVYDITASVDNLNSEGWAWNAGTKTLTLDGLYQSFTGADPAIFLPDGATIDLAPGSENVINIAAVNAAGIFVSGDLFVKGSGALSIFSGGNGILCDYWAGEPGALAITGGAMTIQTTSSNGIMATGHATVSGDSTALNISSGNGVGAGMYAGEGLDFAGEALNITDTAIGIQASGPVSISDGAVGIDASSEAISAYNSPVTISGGNVSLFSGNGNGITAGSISITGGSGVIATGDTNGLNYGAVCATVGDGALTVGAGVTVKGWGGADYTLNSNIASFTKGAWGTSPCATFVNADTGAVL